MRSFRSCLGFALVLACALPLAAQDLAPVTVDARPGLRKVLSPAPEKPRPLTDTYGDTISYVRIDAAQMTPVISGFLYSAVNNGQLRYVTNSGGFTLMAPIHLPGGAQLLSMELDYYDDSATGTVIASPGVCGFSGETCLFLQGTGGCPDSVYALCSGVTNAFGYSHTTANLSGDNVFIDNYLKRYIVFLANTTGDGSTAISQLIVGYKLQVSPAPATATFGDVPTSHPFFQFIEALVAAGITGGCGSGNYCPDNPVTRGQMAVFLAKALGLQFP